MLPILNLNSNEDKGQIKNYARKIDDPTSVNGLRIAQIDAKYSKLPSLRVWSHRSANFHDHSSFSIHTRRISKNFLCEQTRKLLSFITPSRRSFLSFYYEYFALIMGILRNSINQGTRLTWTRQIELHEPCFTASFNELAHWDSHLRLMINPNQREIRCRFFWPASFRRVPTGIRL